MAGNEKTSTVWGDLEVKGHGQPFMEPEERPKPRAGLGERELMQSGLMQSGLTKPCVHIGD